jgi:hypothetical protein
MVRADKSIVYRLVNEPIERWYLQPIAAEVMLLTRDQQESVRRQALIGWLQTILLVVVIVQSFFAGFLRALPPDLRIALSFLHRIEWGAYFGILLILAQVLAGWSTQIVLTNRYRLLAWRFSKPRLLLGNAARVVQLAYLLLALLIVGAVIWVRIHGFVVAPTP